MATAPAAPAELGASSGREALGHPRGLYFLALTETWEKLTAEAARMTNDPMTKAQ